MEAIISDMVAVHLQLDIDMIQEMRMKRMIMRMGKNLVLKMKIKRMYLKILNHLKN
jgi:hypothetical protein